MMKFKYLKVGGGIVWGEHTLTKEMLQMVASGQYDTILNLEDMTEFDADSNEWKPIDGTAAPKESV